MGQEGGGGRRKEGGRPRKKARVQAAPTETREEVKPRPRVCTTLSAICHVKPEKNACGRTRGSEHGGERGESEEEQGGGAH
eukprot:2804879-Rhodomonas_salina.2